MTHPVTGTVAVLPDQLDKGLVRVQSTYAADAADLWSALTEPARLARWVAEVDGELRLGGTFRARFTSGWDGIGRVDACQPPQHLALTMEPGSEDETVIEAWLSADGPRTRLVVEERGMAIGALAAHGAGWQTHLEDLGAYFAGRPISDWGGRCAELVGDYRRTLP